MRNRCINMKAMYGELKHKLHEDSVSMLLKMDMAKSLALGRVAVLVISSLSFGPHQTRALDLYKLVAR